MVMSNPLDLDALDRAYARRFNHTKDYKSWCEDITAAYPALRAAVREEEELRRQLECLIDGDTLHALLAQTQCQLTRVQAERDALRLDVEELRTQHQTALHYLSAERARVDLLGAEVAALTQERDAANETIAAQDRAAREWAQRTATLAAANEALRNALHAIADAALLDQWSAIEILGPALGVPVSQLPSREAFGKVARAALGTRG